MQDYLNSLALRILPHLIVLRSKILHNLLCLLNEGWNIIYFLFL